MRVRLTSVALAALLAATMPVAAALPYRVELQGKALEGASEDASATLHARRVDGAAEPVRRDVTVPSNGSLPDFEGTWELRLESERWWAAPVYVRQSADDAAAVLVAMPAGRLQARVTKVDAPPKELRLLLTPSEQLHRGERFRAEIACPVREGETLCTIPIGSWDIQFAAAGFVPQHRWNVTLTADQVTKLEPIPLLKGAAVMGTVTRVDRTLALPADTRVRLVPSTVAPQLTHALSFEAKPNAKGFFQIVSVPPGEYFITAAAKSLTSDSRQIVVIANRTAELRAPLLIDTPRRVKATIDPKVDPDGEPWMVSVSAKRPGGQELDSYSTSKADAEGVWEQKGLRDGEYLLTVERGGGGQWASVWFTLAGGDLDLPVSVALLKVEGTVSYGDQPIAARVTFGGEFGPRRQSLTANEEGKFAGVIPEPEGESWDVYIEADAPPTHVTLHGVLAERKPDDPVVRVDLRLPRTAVFGSVTQSDGTPVGYAVVNVRGTAGDVDQVSTEKDGTFQISGMPPGSYEIVAESFLMNSDVVRYDIREDDNPPLRLIVRDVQQVKGRVVTAAGVPVIGAQIGALPVNASKVGAGFETSNEHGAFVMQIRPDVSVMDILIAPPGFATVMGRTQVRADRYMEVTVDQHGGSLIAELPPGRDGLVTHEGATWSLYLVAWAASGSDEKSEASRRITIPSLHPGEYTVCVSDRCKSGYVPPHGTLRLSLN